jgi:carboxypeptidase C (cathepsin A)
MPDLNRPALALAALLLAASPTAVRAQAAPAPFAAAQPARTPIVAVTRHTGRFGGVAVSYTATVAETFLRNPAGAPVASVVTIAYTRDDVRDRTHRPVMFLFNGGPGASSSPLHTTALGPMRRLGGNTGPASQGEVKWVENHYSPLDAFDLVFIDPVNTGFSRSFPGVDPRQWYNTQGDATAVKSVIAEWLRAHRRESSPRYLAGESYGTLRAAAMLKYGPALRFDGVLLIAVAGEAPGREMPYVVSLPTMAAGAWHHGKIDRAGRTVAQVYDEALAFARTEYVTALIRGASLPAADRQRIAARMSALIGLPAELIQAENLRVSKNTFMFNLLKDRGLRTGLLDMRVTAPLEPGQLGDIDDPALGVVPKRVPGAPPGPPPNPASIGPVKSAAVAAYLRDQLKFQTDEPYYSINFTANSQWSHEARGGGFAPLAAAMRADPKLRLFWATGYYDLTTPSYSARYTFDQEGIPADRLTAVYFEGPHGVYKGEQNLASFTRAVRTFVAGAR